MELIFFQVLLVLVVLSSFKASANEIKCYKCESDYLQTKDDQSCEGARDLDLIPCKKVLSDPYCKTEWKLDKDNVLVSIKRSCADSVDQAMSKNGAYCKNDDWNKQKDGECFCDNDKCNDRTFPFPAWKRKNYKYPFSTGEIVGMVLGSLAFVLVLGLCIWCCLKKKKAKKNRDIATVETEREAEEAKSKESSPYPKSDKTQEKILHRMSIESIDKVGKSESVEFKTAETEPDSESGASTPNS